MTKEFMDRYDQGERVPQGRNDGTTRFFMQQRQSTGKSILSSMNSVYDNELGRIGRKIYP